MTNHKKGFVRGPTRGPKDGIVKRRRARVWTCGDVCGRVAGRGACSGPVTETTEDRERIRSPDRESGEKGG